MQDWSVLAVTVLGGLYLWANHRQFSQSEASLRRQLHGREIPEMSGHGRMRWGLPSPIAGTEAVAATA